MKKEMMASFDEAVKKFGNVEGYILIVCDDKHQMNCFRGPCANMIALAASETAGVMEFVDRAIKKAKLQIKIDELIAEAEKLGITLPGMDDDTEVEAEEKE